MRSSTTTAALLAFALSLPLACTSVTQVGQSAGTTSGTSSATGAGGSGGSGGTGGSPPHLTGDPLWAKDYGGSPNGTPVASPRGVAVDAQGNILLTAVYNNSIDLGCGPLPSDPTYGGRALAKLDPGGACLWSKGFAPGTFVELWALATDAAGDVVVAGTVSGAVDLGGGVQGGPLSDSFFVLSFDPAGNYRWERRFANTAEGSAQAASVGTDSAGNVLVSGTVTDTMDLGSGPHTGGGGGDVFLLKLDAQGNSLWDRRFGGDLDQRGYQVTTDEKDNAILVGSVLGAIDFGGGPLTGDGGFVAELDPQGEVLWATHTDQGFSNVARDAADNLFVAATAHAPAGSPKDDDIVVAKLAPKGALLWSHRYGDSAAQEIYTLGVDSQGNVVVGGSIAGTVDFGNGPLPGDTMHSDAFAVKLDPSGAALWTQRFTGSPSSGILALGLDPAGDTVLAGWFVAQITLGAVTLTATNGGLFLAKLAP